MLFFFGIVVVMNKYSKKFPMAKMATRQTNVQLFGQKPKFHQLRCQSHKLLLFIFLIYLENGLKFFTIKILSDSSLTQLIVHSSFSQ